MNKIVFLILAIADFSLVQAQNVGIGTTTPVAKLHIKGNQDSSQLIIDANATQSNAHPLIRLRKSDGSDLLQIHSNDSTNIFMGVGSGHSQKGYENLFIGRNSGYNSTGGGNIGFGNLTLVQNTTGANNVAIGFGTMQLNESGQENTGIGPGVLYSNIGGSQNTAVGTNVMANNTSGSYNTAVGYEAMISNTAGIENTAFGSFALLKNSGGQYNTAYGSNALFYNDFGTDNTALGFDALYNNTGGAASFNTAVGHLALYSTTNSEYNTAIGYQAGSSYDNGYNNVFVGANTDVSGDGYYNVIAIGQGTIATGSSQVTLGNGATGEYRAYANWSNISDGRFKRNVRENVPGLDFIAKLRPVTYNLSATELDAFLHRNKGGRAAVGFAKALQEKETETVTGFVAQEVETAARSLGYNFSGVEAPKNDKDVYALRYAEFVVPLVKGMQEQQQMITELQKEVAQLKEQNKVLLQLIKK